MEKKKFGLVARISLAIVLGIALGTIAPAPLVRASNTFSALFDQFIRFVVPLIIIGFVTPAIADTGRDAGKLLLVTVGLAYASTLFSGLFSYASSAILFPKILDPSLAGAAEAASLEFPSYFSIAIPPLADVMSALVFAFLAGLGIVAADSRTLKAAASEFRNVVEIALSKAIVPLLPFYIFAIFLDVTAAGKAAAVIRTFASVLAVTFALTLVVIIAQFAIAGAVAGCNPFRKLWTMFPAYMTAMGTSSSAATIPVTLRQTLANGVRPETANFVIPLCATVHLAGSMVKLVCFTLSILVLDGRPVEFSQFLYFIALTGVAMIAAPGVPGGAVMAAIGIVASFFGLTPSQQGLMIALYVATDGFGTACNITGDGAIALIVDKISGKTEKGKSPENGTV